MSSRRKSSGRSSPAVNTKRGPPPSYPQEHHAEHRLFLIRSLDRCDTELAALMELHRSLQKSKTRLVELCGEATLLDLGEGRFQVSPVDESLVAVKSDDKTTPPSLPASLHAREVCVDFLLRMKLRRKLLSRLARRLNRLAHCMDGEEVSPPGPPKYGDLRLHVDPKAVSEFQDRWKRQQEALDRMRVREENKHVSEEEEKVEEKSPEEKEQMDTEEKEKTAPEEPAEQDKPAEQEESPEEEAVMEPMDTETPTQAKEGTAPKAPADEAKHEAPVSVEVSSSVPPETTSSSDVAAALLEDDRDVLRDYNPAYEKSISSGDVVKYTILDQDPPEDHSLIKYGAGIGAVHKSMNSREKEMECQRWQHALLQRIPEQPTLSELGLANRVFFANERRRKIQQEERESPKKKQKKEAIQKQEGDMDDSDSESEQEKEDGVEESDAMEVDEAEEPEDQDDDDDEDFQQDEDDDDSESSEAEVKHDAKKKKKEPEALKPTKLISLAATPSFYEQDKKRLMLIHAELMATSITDHARRRVTEVTTDYNMAYRRSNDAYMRKMRTESQLNIMLRNHRGLLSTLPTTTSPEQEKAARAAWAVRKQAHDMQRAQRCLPVFWGKAPIGTPKLSEAAADRSDTARALVAHTLQNVVDGVVTRTTDPNWKEEVFSEPMPAANPSDAVVDPTTGETLRQRHERLEAPLRKDMVVLTTRLQQAEEERKRAWRKMLKTKAEFDIPHQHITNTGGRRSRMQVDPRQFHLLPVPPLGTGGILPTPTYTAPSTPSYTPPAVTPSHVKFRAAYGPKSDSKYSATRLQERVGSDGTVQPATAPRKMEDGLYQRPAGRARKGMDWDAVRGVWVPSANPEE